MEEGFFRDFPYTFLIHGSNELVRTYIRMYGSKIGLGTYFHFVIADHLKATERMNVCTTRTFLLPAAPIDECSQVC